MPPQKKNAWEEMPPTLLYEDKHLMAVDKPADVPVYPLKEKKERTLAHALLCYDTALEAVGPAMQAGIVHRLDNDTSGVLLVARSMEVYQALRKIWNTGKVTKKYQALVIGNFPNSKTIEYPIAHHPSNSKKMLVCTSPVTAEKYGAREAISQIRCIQQYKKYSLLEVEIKTGVRHQIRAHLANEGFPIAGDKLYQNPEKRRQDTLPLQRHFLHLAELQLAHPVSGRHLRICSELSTELKGILKEIL